MKTDEFKKLFRMALTEMIPGAEYRNTELQDGILSDGEIPQNRFKSETSSVVNHYNHSQHLRSGSRQHRH